MDRYSKFKRVLFIWFVLLLFAGCSPEIISDTSTTGFKLTTMESIQISRYDLGGFEIADLTTATLDHWIPPLSYIYWHADRSEGTGYYGHWISDASIQIKFFICDQANFDLWTDGQTASVYVRTPGASSLDWTFILPHTDTWYFMYYNEYNLLYSAHITGHHHIDTTPPAISWNVDDGATYSGQRDITATITEEIFDIYNVELRIDGILVDEGPDSSFSYTWNTVDYSNGDYDLFISAQDTVGNSGHLSATVTVSNTSLVIPLFMAGVGLFGLVLIAYLFMRGKGPDGEVLEQPSYPPLGPEPTHLSTPPIPRPRFCPFCATPMSSDTAKFCAECGGKLQSA
ncbi:MAG: Ig-like domain-containing protein [Candidatus Thorarchaeota archaeon]